MKNLLVEVYIVTDSETHNSAAKTTKTAKYEFTRKIE